MILCATFASLAVLIGSDHAILAASAPNFATDVAPILEKNCLACHSSSEHKGRLVLESYETLMQGGKHGREVVANDAASSRLVEMLEGKINPQMPVDADPLSDSDITKIKAWIDAGASGPASDESPRRSFALG